MSKPLNDSTFFYTEIEDGFLVGTNESLPHGNGAVQGTSISGTVSIPDTFQNKPILEIGQYAFCRCHKITRIFMGRFVKVINTYGFGDLPNIESITIIK